MESCCNGPQLSPRHDDDDDDRMPSLPPALFTAACYKHIRVVKKNLRSTGTLTTCGGGAAKPGGGGPTSSGCAISPTINHSVSYNFTTG